ncbi:guanine nucleotide-binding protein subunit beta-2-like 1 protein [Angomonas deanei]|uniref:WD domain, G-beta repeat, putative n=1 Tax=Angomonas deanei TaxID=59799 RepID=S9VE00_9TRYP|nr:guanine nucleotide-binding protein subunit beta-2-like 1 protein [Angomonas deanei]EPY29825.1 guanine nucleotide-binding protein subunit beta-2-like 1 protein [Angomonas deanei]EPY39199.1 guanine nucleotide-binding protein subunit beta-2-like 1 protein [Angomonas deanei]EPY43048.1 guanine nucleotide-binding protein subunit beta-2-like 1 protein [Angomonas deanei]CAD2218725.1 WD domain, G-beta repeat, putative [Angomonas deanei]|eukprot:EPY28367.1 guanine nucleotide-binding protein subunit beta-2-like 1 protein [Angomonas deanei]
MNYEGSLLGHRNWITSLACPQQTDSHIKVVSTSRDNTCITWKANPNRHDKDDAYAIPEHRLEGHTGFVSSVSLAHNSEYEFGVTGSWDHSLRLWNLRTGQCQHKYIKHTKDVLAVAFSPDDRQIVSAGRDNIIHVWNIKGECVHSFENNRHTDWISSLCFSPNAAKPIVVSGSWDTTVKVWDITSGKCERTLVDKKDQPEYITSVTVSPDGSLCASGGKDGFARLWDITSEDLLFKINVGFPINQIAFSPNRFWMSVACGNLVRIYDLESKNLVVELAPNSARYAECTCLAWSADGDTVYSGYTDGVICAWSVNNTE